MTTIEHSGRAEAQLWARLPEFTEIGLNELRKLVLGREPATAEDRRDADQWIGYLTELGYVNADSVPAPAEEQRAAQRRFLERMRNMSWIGAAPQAPVATRTVYTKAPLGEIPFEAEYRVAVAKARRTAKLARTSWSQEEMTGLKLRIQTIFGGFDNPLISDTRGR